MDEVSVGLEIAQWLESKAGISVVLLAIVNLAQLALGIYKDRRHKEICLELGQSWIKETEQWAKRIDQMRADTKEAFGSLRDITADGSGVRERIAVSLTQMSEAVRSMTARIDALAADIRDATRTK